MCLFQSQETKLSSGVRGIYSNWINIIYCISSWLFKCNHRTCFSCGKIKCTDNQRLSQTQVIIAQLSSSLSHCNPGIKHANIGINVTCTPVQYQFSQAGRQERRSPALPCPGEGSSLARLPILLEPRNTQNISPVPDHVSCLAISLCFLCQSLSPHAETHRQVTTVNFTPTLYELQACYEIITRLSYWCFCNLFWEVISALLARQHNSGFFINQFCIWAHHCTTCRALDAIKKQHLFPCHVVKLTYLLYFLNGLKNIFL